MLPKYYPVILVAHIEPVVKFKMVHNDEEYTAFCRNFADPHTPVQVIKTLSALSQEIMSQEWITERVKNFAGRNNAQ